jgi:hypothetical protein
MEIQSFDRTLLEKSLLVKVELHRLGIARRASLDDVVVDAEKALLRLNKRILDSAAFDAVKQVDGAIRHYVDDITGQGPWPGTKILSVDALQVFDARLGVFAEDRVVLTEAFLRQYDADKIEAQIRLRSQYREEDYPPLERVRASFWFVWSYLTWDVPGKLQGLRADIFARETTRFRAEVQSVARGLEADLQATAQGLLDAMIERLTPDPDGKPKRFKNSLIDNVTKWLENLPYKNLSNAADLEAIGAEMRRVLAGVTPDELRRSARTREAVLADVTQIKNTLDGFVLKGQRMYSDAA